MKSKPLTAVQWASQFERKELAAGVIWEYARESKEIQAIAKRLRTIKAQGGFANMTATVAGEFSAYWNQAEAILTLFGVGESFEHFPVEWLSLPQPLRARMAVAVPTLGRFERNKVILRKTTAFAPASERELDLFIRRCAVDKLNGIPANRFTWSEGEASTGLIVHDVRCFTIDWAQPSRKIISTFKDWIIRNRPVEFPQRKKGQRVSDLSTYLEWIGTMRRVKPSLRGYEENQKTEKARRLFKQLFSPIRGDRRIPHPYLRRLFPESKEYGPFIGDIVLRDGPRTTVIKCKKPKKVAISFHLK